MANGETREFPLTEVQRSVVEAPPGRMVFVGGPGAGKSLVVAERAIWLLHNGLTTTEKLLLLAPSRRAAKAVERYIRERLRGAPGPKATSFHGLALSILYRNYRQMGYDRLPELLYTARHFHTLRQLLQAEDPAVWPHHGRSLLSQTLPKMAYDLIMGAADNGLDVPDLRRLARDSNKPELAALIGFYVRQRESQRKAGLVDFGEVLLEVRKLLSSQPESAGDFKHILVDEFEQANYAQAEILRLLVREGTNLLVAGDPEQAINGYRSGSATYLLECAQRFDAQVVVSGENHRSSRRVADLSRVARPENRGFVRMGIGTAVEPQDVEVAETDRRSPVEVPIQNWSAVSSPDGVVRSRQDDEGLASQPEKDDPDDGSDKDSAAEGYVVLRYFTYPSDEARWVASGVESLIRAGVAPGQIAVLSRSLSTALSRVIAAELRRRGIPYHLQSSRDVTAEPLVAAAVKLLRYLAAGEDSAEAVLPVLESPLAGLPPFGLRQLRRAAALVKMDLSRLPAANLDDLPLKGQVREALADFLERLAWLRELPNRGAASLLWEIWRLFPAFHHDALEGRGGSRAFTALLGEISNLQRGRGPLSEPDLLKLWDEGYFDALSAMVPERSGVVVATVHLAKGRQWEAVFLPGLVEGSFPLRPSSQDTVGPLLAQDLAAPARLDPVDGSIDLEMARQNRHLAEERRVFYVAVSRAGRALYLSLSSRGGDGRAIQRPSRFLEAVSQCPSVETVPGDDGEKRPRDVAGAIFYYRQLLASLDPLVQNQAVYALQRLRLLWPQAVRAEEWWSNIREADGAAPPFPNGRLGLSASRLGAYRNCPLAYQFGYHWGLSHPENSAMTTGLLLHKVLEEYHRPGSPVPRTREALKGLLEGYFDEAAFRYRPLAGQARRALREMLDAYFSHYGEIGPALAVEESFRFALGPLTFRGYIDRVDRLDSGAIELIDYKTGAAMTKEQATQDLQLALYDLAFSKDERLGSLGAPKKVSYLYLKAIGGPRADGKRGFEPDDETRARLEQRVSYLANSILAERFPSRFAAFRSFTGVDPADLKALQQNSCYFCSYGWICPDMQRGSGVE